MFISRESRASFDHSAELIDHRSSALGPQDLHGNPGRSGSDKAETPGGEAGHADFSPLDEWSSIVDTHNDTPVVLDVGQFHLRSEWQRTMGSGQSIAAKALPARCASTVVSS